MDKAFPASHLVVFTFNAEKTLFEFAGRQGEKSRNKLSGNSATKTSDWSRYATDEMDADIQRDIANSCGTFFLLYFLTRCRQTSSLVSRETKKGSRGLWELVYAFLSAWQGGRPDRGPGLVRRLESFWVDWDIENLLNTMGFLTQYGAESAAQKAENGWNG